jgi:flavin-dependent dehydrogenase
MHRSSALIIGGGPAGCAAAIQLSRAGHRPLLLERTREPHDLVCGGFVSADTIGMLRRIGLDTGRLGASPIERVRLVSGRRQVEASLPFAAAGLSRRRVDAVLLETAREAGASVERGVIVRRIDCETRRVVLCDGAELEADALFIASGKHDVRGSGRPVEAAGRRPSVGFRAQLGRTRMLTTALQGVIELHLFEGGYAGLLLQEDGAANFCFSVSAARLKAAGSDPEQLIAGIGTEAPLLAERLGTGSERGSWSSVARIPYGWRARSSSAGIFRLGDQAAVIASLAGDGIAIALASGGAAGDALLRSGPDAAIGYQRAFARRAARPLGIASALRKISENPLFSGPLLAMLGLQPKAIALAASLTRI